MQNEQTENSMSHILVWTGDEGCNWVGTFEELAMRQREYSIEHSTQIVELV